MTAAPLPNAGQPPDADPPFTGPGSWTGADVAGYLAAGVPPRVMRRVLARFPHPAGYERAAAERPAELAAAGLPKPAPRLRDLPDGCWLALYGTPDYPAALADAPAAPLLLYGRGRLTALRTPGLAVVGTREMTSYGAAVAATAVAAGAELNATVVSGLARGVDAAAHTAALDAGVPTVAVLPTGVDTVYPAAHTELAARIIAAGGALVSEQPFGTATDTAPGRRPAPIAARLQARNRIIAALAAVLVPAEAAAGSGTLGAVWAAFGMGRTVLVALPKAHAAALPGAQVPAGLAWPHPRTAEQLQAMGASAALAKTLAGRAPLAAGTARDREELALLVRTALLTSTLRSPAA